MAGKRGLTVEIITDTAIGLLEECGLERLTIQELANRLSIKPASLYKHISGLEEIINLLARSSLLQIEAVIRDIAVGRSKEDALMEMALAYRRFAKENPGLYKVFIRSASLEDPDLDETGRAIMRIIYQVLQSYECNYEDAIHFTRGFRSALHGFITLEAAGFFHGKADVDDSFTKMIEGNIALLTNLNKRSI
jgi:AcrR family transcriptional regulator